MSLNDFLNKIKELEECLNILKDLVVANETFENKIAVNKAIVGENSTDISDVLEQTNKLRQVNIDLFNRTNSILILKLAGITRRITTETDKLKLKLEENIK